MDQLIGKVVNYDYKRGFGFINGRRGGNYFFHINDTQDRFILINSIVAFDLYEDPRTNKTKAINIVIVESD